MTKDDRSSGLGLRDRSDVPLVALAELPATPAPVDLPDDRSTIRAGLGSARAGNRRATC